MGSAEQTFATVVIRDVVAISTYLVVNFATEWQRNAGE